LPEKYETKERKKTKKLTVGRKALDNNVVVAFAHFGHDLSRNFGSIVVDRHFDGRTFRDAPVSEEKRDKVRRRRVCEKRGNNSQDNLCHACYFRSVELLSGGFFFFFASVLVWENESVAKKGIQ
jgi:hypothetical protein